jgi:hypothetical protein
MQEEFVQEQTRTTADKLESFYWLSAACPEIARKRLAAVPFRHALRVSLTKSEENCCNLAKICYVVGLMAILKKNAFSRRVPDLVTEELVAVLSRRSSFEFKQLFDIVHENLRARNAASGGEEMLRLRAYEKLQNLVARGAVKKNGKKYKGLPAALAQAIAQQNGHLAGVK